jgi:hypothetical protein
MRKIWNICLGFKHFSVRIIYNQVTLIKLYRLPHTDLTKTYHFNSNVWQVKSFVLTFFVVWFTLNLSFQLWIGITVYSKFDGFQLTKLQKTEQSSIQSVQIAQMCSRLAPGSIYVTKVNYLQFRLELRVKHLYRFWMI